MKKSFSKSAGFFVFYLSIFTGSVQANESVFTLKGFVLSNTYYNDAGVNNADIPNTALSGSQPSSGLGTFGGTVRQSRLTLKATGPELDGALGSAKTSAILEADFFGSFPNSTFAASQPQPRLRLGYIKIDWPSTSLTFGQDWIILAPLNPTSLAHLSIAPLSSSGNLWNRFPQIRIDQKVNLINSFGILTTFGILRPVAGDNWTSNGSQLDTSGNGEHTTHPFYQGRIEFSVNVMDQPAILGISGHYGNENTTTGPAVETHAAALDLTLPLGPVMLTGEAFTGKNLDQFLELGGLLNQGINLQNNEVASQGGWAQLAFLLSSNVSVNLAYGIDQADFDDSINKKAYNNRTVTANVIWKLGPKLSAGLEYDHINTDYKNDTSGNDNYYNLAIGYYF